MKQKILLTGDDGYNSIGIRLLIHLLHDSYDLNIAATKVQQSGVGGKINMKGGEIQEIIVDGVSGISVDGSPVDAIECANVYYKEKFDWVISGMNLGVNIGGYNISSGTFSAAFYSLFSGLATRVIAVSLDIDPSLHGYTHNGTDSLAKYIEYPGIPLSHLLPIIFSTPWYDAPLFNINFPYGDKYNRKVSITSLRKKTEGYWTGPVVDLDNQRFYYPSLDHKAGDTDITIDAGAIAQGYVSVTPLFPYMIPDGQDRQKYIPKKKIFSL